MAKGSRVRLNADFVLDQGLLKADDVADSVGSLTAFRI
jgi:hypothetical protein